MIGQSSLSDLFSQISAAGFFKRLFSWKSIKETAARAEAEARNAEAVHAAEMREIAARLSEAESRLRTAELSREEALRAASGW